MEDGGAKEVKTNGMRAAYPNTELYWRICIVMNKWGISAVLITLYIALHFGRSMNALFGMADKMQDELTVLGDLFFWHVPTFLHEKIFERKIRSKRIFDIMRLLSCTLHRDLHYKNRYIYYVTCTDRQIAIFY